MSSHDAFHYRLVARCSPPPLFTRSLSRWIYHLRLWTASTSIDQVSTQSFLSLNPIPSHPSCSESSPSISINAQNASCKIFKSIDPFPTTQPSMCPTLRSIPSIYYMWQRVAPLLSFPPSVRMEWNRILFLHISPLQTKPQNRRKEGIKMPYGNNDGLQNGV